MGSVLNAQQPLDTVIDINPDYKNLDMRDRGFVRMLVTTCLRRLGEIDTLIAKAQDKPDSRFQPVLRNILRLGMAQILYLNVPDHAAVDTSVRLTQSHGLGKFKGLVNGILRNLTRNVETWRSEIDPVRVNIPDWLYDRWLEDYDGATADKIAQASLQEAPLDLSVKDSGRLEQTVEMLSKKLSGEILWNGTLRLESGGQIPDLAGYDDGTWWVQDISASLPVHILGDVTGRDVIDLCAAPGGKTAQLAARGAFVQSLDRSARRLKRLMDNMDRLRLTDQITPISADAAVWQPEEAVDIVVLDAPCSATGTLRRNPDILHLKSERDVIKMAEVQRRLLVHAASMIKPGGTLLFCTCSLHKQEGEDQIDWFLSGDPRFRRVPVSPDDFGEKGGIECFFIV